MPSPPERDRRREAGDAGSYDDYFEGYAIHDRAQAVRRSRALRNSWPMGQALPGVRPITHPERRFGVSPGHSMHPAADVTDVRRPLL